MRLRLFKKYFVTTSLIVLLSLTVMLMIVAIVFNNYVANSNYSSLGKTCKTVAGSFSRYGSEQDDQQNTRNLYDIASNLAEVADFDIFVADAKGQVRLCSCEEWGQNGSCRHSGGLISAAYLEQAEKEDFRGLDTLGIYREPHYTYAVPVADSGKTVGYVIAAAPMSATRTLMNQMIRLYLMSAVIPIVVMFFAIYAMTYRLTKPMKQMSEAARAMAKGDFSRRIPVTSDDEIGELAVSFNQMTNSLVQLEGMRRSFVANVSHELKTPMTTIGGFIDGILDGTIKPEKQEYYLGIVSAEVKRLSRLLQSMLSLSKLESGEFVLKPEPFDFRELLLNIVISQEQRIEQSRLNIDGLDGLPDITVNADRDLIYQAVYNLVDNAVKFTDEGGTVSFALRSDAKRMYFEIRNTGRGIPADALPYIFERFYKVDKSRSANKNSTGLGLYLVKTILKIHGGSVSAASRENEFTAFTVTLPLNRSERAREHAGRTH